MRPLSGLQNRDKLPHLLSTICATRPRWSPRNRENPRQPRSIHRATMKIHAMKKHSPSACRKTGLEFRQIDDKWWFDFEFATVSRRLKSPTHLSLRITPGQSVAEKTFTAAGFHSGTKAPFQPPFIVDLPEFASENPTTTHSRPEKRQGESIGLPIL